MLIIFLDSRLDTRTSKFLTRDSKLDVFEFRGSSLEDQGSRDCQLSFQRYCNLFEMCLVSLECTGRTLSCGIQIVLLMERLLCYLVES